MLARGCIAFIRGNDSDIQDIPWKGVFNGRLKIRLLSDIQDIPWKGVFNGRLKIRLL